MTPYTYSFIPYTTTLPPNKIYPTLYETPSIINVRIIFANDVIIKDYTSKLVKSLLLSSNPDLDYIFSSIKFPFKPLRITPLYIVSNNKRFYVYSKFVPKHPYLVPPKQLKPIVLKHKTPYYFTIVVPIYLLNNVLDALSSIDSLIFGYFKVVIKQLSYNITHINLEHETNNIRNVLISSEYLKISFDTPCLLRNPFVIRSKPKKKVFFFPTPDAVFMTPLAMYLIDKGLYSYSFLLRLLRYILSVLDTPYSALASTKIIYYSYDNHILPAFIGYVKYYIDHKTLSILRNKLLSKYNIDLPDLLSYTLSIAQVFGIGTSRAIGFGSISYQLY